MILAQARHLLAQVLHPLSYEQFFQEVVSRRPLLLAADAALPARQLLGADPKALLLSQFAEYAATLTCHIRQAQMPAPLPTGGSGSTCTHVEHWFGSATEHGG